MAKRIWADVKRSAVKTSMVIEPGTTDEEMIDGVNGDCYWSMVR
jgi:hypothetical protein